MKAVHSQPPTNTSNNVINPKALGDKNKRRYLTRLRLDLENALFNYERRYIEEELVQKAVDEVRENFDVKWKE